MKKCLVVLLLALTMSVYAIETKTPQGHFSAEVKLSPMHLQLNDLLNVEIALTFPPTYLPQIDLLRKDLFTFEGLQEPPFTLASENIAAAHLQEDGMNQQIITFTLAPQITGKHYLAFRKIIFHSMKNEEFPAVTLISNVFEVSVTAPPIDFNSQDLIEPLLPLSKELPVNMTMANRHKYTRNPALKAHEAAQALVTIQRKTLPWEMILALITVSVVYVLITKYPSKTPPPKVGLSAIRAPSTVALEQLQALLDSKLMEKKDYQNFFYTLDHIVRTYIDRKYQLNAQMFTTKEFVEKSITSSAIDGETKQKLAAFFENSDRVKFARYKPTQEECATAMHAAQQFLAEDK